MQPLGRDRELDLLHEGHRFTKCPPGVDDLERLLVAGRGNQAEFDQPRVDIEEAVSRIATVKQDLALIQVPYLHFGREPFKVLLFETGKQVMTANRFVEAR